MDINLIYFSPTGTTRKIIRALSKEFSELNINDLNITKPDLSKQKIEIAEGSLTLIGVPVYSGRVAQVAVDRLKGIKAKNSAVVLVAVYGNRDYDDALIELNNLATNSGFNVIAAAAFIGEHSFSISEKPIAEGRPDEADIEKCYAFSKEIKSRLNTLSDSGRLGKVFIPGQYPYKELKPLPQFTPTSDSNICDLCGICADSCPTGAITISKEVFTDTDLCIWCCACVKACPTEARVFKDGPINDIIERLSTNCAERKEPEFFLS